MCRQIGYHAHLGKQSRQVSLVSFDAMSWQVLASACRIFLHQRISEIFCVIADAWANFLFRLKNCEVFDQSFADKK